MSVLQTEPAAMLSITSLRGLSRNNVVLHRFINPERIWKGNPSLLERLKTSDSVEDAATAFLREYEKCKDLDREEIERVSAAKQIYEVFQEYQSPVE